MKITIHHPEGFNEIGGRPNNEDSIYPPPGSAGVSDLLFLVCDGVGGEHKGEVASALACTTLSTYFSRKPERPISLEYVQTALEHTRLAFEKLEGQDQDTRGMATTLTLLYIDGSEIVIAHLGDSRIFQIRNGKIISQTKDHKWVNELVESGLITEDQAREHPKKNVITKVITASRTDAPDFKRIDDVKQGDYFFMCTDGVLEQLYDELLEYHLRDHTDNQVSPAQMLAAIKEECEGKTNDNFSAYLIKIGSVNGPTLTKAIKTDNTIQAKPSQTAAHTHKPKGILYTIALLVALVCAGSVFFFTQNKKEETKQVFQASLPVASGTSDKPAPSELPDAQDQPVTPAVKKEKNIPTKAAAGPKSPIPGIRQKDSIAKDSSVIKSQPSEKTGDHAITESSPLEKPAVADEKPVKTPVPVKSSLPVEDPK